MIEIIRLALFGVLFLSIGVCLYLATRPTPRVRRQEEEEPEE